MGHDKVYVDVNATFTKDGRLLPKSFVWEDGMTYEISRVRDIRRAASLADGREVYLFYEDNNMWFVER